MNAEPRILRTKAEDEFAAIFRAELPRLPGGDTAKLWREAAFGQFERTGLPHRRVEAWKYTDLRALLRTVPPLAKQPSREQLAKYLVSDSLPGLERARIVIVNGVYRADLSDLTEADGISVESVSDVLSTRPEHVGLLLDDKGDAMLALNTALMQGGVVVRVAKDARPSVPIEIAHVAALDQPATIVVRNVVDVGDNAEVRFLETFAGPGGSAYHVNAVTELQLWQGAKVRWSRLQGEGADATHVGSLATRIGPDAELDHLIVSAGAALSRWQGFVHIDGRGARVGFFGANMLTGKEHGDLALVVTHAEGNSQSRELFKNVIDGDAQGAFQGRIVVEPDAQKTDAKMMTQALLLSDRAEFASKPELEIFADDVQCGHGATTGRIDESMIFYLLARGIPRPEAERLLIEAFLADAIDAIRDEPVAEALKKIVSAWVGRRGAAS